ncbi:MAG: LysR family transcriptional regulator [Bdellovibrionales bacterium]|nr:LysR family transcriptional regulator [Bdellovibrionales bacterium]
MEKLINIEALYLFTKVVQAGSFSAVGQRLKIPKATLSRKISQLEAQLGTQLLVRTTRNLQPTEVGRELLQRAFVILAAMEDSQQLVSKKQKEPQGKLRISAGVEFGLSVLNPLINRFAAKYPKVDIELDLTGRLVDLVYENLDIGIRIGPMSDSTLGSRKLGSFSYGLYCSPKVLEKLGYPKSIEGLRKFPKLGFTRGNKSEEWRLHSGSKIEVLKFNPRISSNNYWVLIDSAVEGLGVAFMPSFLASEAIKSKKLIHILPQWSSEEFPIQAIYPQQKFVSQKVRHFIDFISDQIKIPRI